MQSPALENLLTLLRFASISTDPDHRDTTRKAADWLVAKLGAIGLKTELHETPGHPVIIARNKHVPGRRTVLLYGHYDVQPTSEDKDWINGEPFNPFLVDGSYLRDLPKWDTSITPPNTGQDTRIVARGSTDNKGQLMAHYSGLEKTLREHGDLPVNLVCLFEGEEEIGSPNLKPFLEAHREELKCDVVAISDTGMVASGVGTFTYGLRGIACCEVIARGPATDLHSGIWGGAVANPITMLSRLIASLHDAEGTVQVGGFYNDVKELAKWEREAWQKLGDSEPETKQITGVPELFGEAGFSDLERRWARPTAEVNGIKGGYQGKGSKTVIAHDAMVKLSFRLVPDQDPENILQKIAAHVRVHEPAGVRFEFVPGHTGSPYLTDPFSPFGLAAQKALEKTFGTKPALIREGGSIPIVQAFKEVLGADTLLLGLALPDCAAHAPNENFPVANFEAGILLNQNLLRELAA